jgi:hypothetical protein
VVPGRAGDDAALPQQASHAGCHGLVTVLVGIGEAEGLQLQIDAWTKPGSRSERGRPGRLQPLSIGEEREGAAGGGNGGHGRQVWLNVVWSIVGNGQRGAVAASRATPEGIFFVRRLSTNETDDAHSGTEHGPGSGVAILVRGLGFSCGHAFPGLPADWPTQDTRHLISTLIPWHHPDSIHGIQTSDV